MFMRINKVFHNIHINTFIAQIIQTPGTRSLKRKPNNAANTQSIPQNTGAVWNKTIKIMVKIV